MKWEDIQTKYPNIDRDNMSEQEELSFVEDCFSCYENEGFSKKFWSPFSDYANRIGQNFNVVGRCTTALHHISKLPMWDIKFEDGTIISAYPEEIIPREMKGNGCDLIELE